MTIADKAEMAHKAAKAAAGKRWSGMMNSC